MRTEWVERAAWIHDRVALLEVYWGETALVASYLVEGKQRLLIDTGTTDTPLKALAPALARLGRRLDDVDLVVNTHGHVDHAWGNGQVQASALGAGKTRVLMHAADAPLLQPVVMHDLQAQRRSALGVLDAEATAEQEARRRTAEAAPPNAPAPDGTVSDGDILDLGAGVRLRVLHTPGHSPGSLCLYWEAERVLFSGDSLGGSVDGARFPILFDVRAYRDSLERVQRLPVQLVCPAHRYPFRPPNGTVSDPLRRGPDAGRFLADSLTTALLMEASAVEARQALPGASRQEQAQDAVARFSRAIGLEATGQDISGNANALLAAALWLRELSGE